MDDTIRLWPQTRKLGVCQACGTFIAWFQTIAGARMPMELEAVAQSMETDLFDRELGLYRARDSHWPHCPATARYRRRRTDRA